ncbi:MAG: hypothetical protein SAK29_18090 [Scytonema sp. PMC 1069.18]|nr:hypothetical protein [Scytonema sp. PMC 1069.18]MEC4880107.1 hypothetical protein [Scytonema sp. PMC 1070.18]
MSSNELPLYELFLRLRASGFLLGISDYNLLLEVLLARYDTSQQAILNLGIPNRDTLKQLCQTLWVKSVSQRLQFEAIFDEIFVQSTPSESLGDRQNKLSPFEQPQQQKEQAEQSRQDSPTQTENPKNSKTEYFFLAPDPSLQPPEPTTEDDKVITAVRTGKQREWISFKPSGLPHEYFPVTARQMEHGWYSLRHSVRKGVGLELDTAATIDQIKQKGKFFHPVQKPRLLKSGQLVLLIDQKGSMQPFHVLSRLLVETALQTGCLEKTDCYYFNNYPRRVLYNDPQFQTESPVAEVMARLHRDRHVVLIFSDAGAARGDFILRRIEKTCEFLTQLQGYSKTIAWLNPMPQDSWDGTTAEAIANEKIVQMFPADFIGFEKAIKVLQ